MSEAMKKVLNVGGGSKLIKLPNYYDGFEQILLDIDPLSGADVVMDARELQTLEANSYDAIYCSHNLEHYYPHDAGRVLAGFNHICKPDGFIEIRVPDVKAVFKKVAESGMELTDELYKTKAGLSISALDVIYGRAESIRKRGEDFMAHKTGFSLDLLRSILGHYGFPKSMRLQYTLFEIRLVAFKTQPSEALLNAFAAHRIVQQPAPKITVQA